MLVDDFEEKYLTEQPAESEEIPYRRRYRKKKKRFPLGKIFGTILIVFFIVYFSMAVYTSNFSVMQTEQVTYQTLSDYIEVNAFALRKEEYIQNTKEGIISYTIGDGEKVNAKGSVAQIFASESDVEAWQQYNGINSELLKLKQLVNAENNMFVDLDTVDAQIVYNTGIYKNTVQSGRLNRINEIKLDLLQLYNERAVITSGAANFEPRIAQLEEELASISLPKSLGEVKSKKSGVFVSSSDGYELAFDYDRAEQLTAAELANKVKKDPPSNAVGKVITNPNWYLLCPVTSEQAVAAAGADGTVTISVPKVISYTIPGTVVVVNQGSKTEDGLMIIKCDYMDGSLANIREEEITIKTLDYKGLRVNRRAVHDGTVTVYDYDENGEVSGSHEERVQGVYVIYGNKLNFEEINIIYSEKDFVICDPDPASEALKTGATIKLYDEIVVQGKELYDGKAIR